jgi:endonuclease/exonuclease/phosphatase family metal-dependent hydrolase
MKPLRALLVMAVLLVPGVHVFAQPVPPIDQPIELKVMTFNIWLGGDQVNIGKVVEAIEAADADVVGLQEAVGSERRIAEALGWPYVDERMQVISKYPLLDPPGGNGIYTLVEPLPGQVIAIENVHLPSTPYGPEAVRDGSTLDEVMALERETRLPSIQDQITAAKHLVAKDIPVILTGDFNAPSALDWTGSVMQARPAVSYPVAWPVSTALLGAGFRDTYRSVHPDAVANPGLTWTPGYPAGSLRPNETFDRIDLIYAAGAIETVSSEIVGEAGESDVDIAVTPWPSDHRAVVSTLTITPGVPPLAVSADQRRVEAGDDVTIRFHALGQPGETLALLPDGGDPATDQLMALSTGESIYDGSVTFGTATLVPGEYDVALLDASGRARARNSFWVVEQNALPALSVSASSYASGDPIEVSWTNAPGTRWDWIALFDAGDPALENYYAYVYTGAQVSGTAILDETVIGGALAPGDYVLRLFRDDGYALLAEVSFTVTE